MWLLKSLFLLVLCHLGLSLSIFPKDDVDPHWWKQAVFYQVYPRSFFDSNGDGIGDLEGVRQKASYLEELGIGGIWLNPIFESPMKDFGYDISNYTNIEPIFGTLEDFTNMMEEYTRRGIKVVLDYVPNHTSDKHLWFEKSKLREEPYTNYYVWVNGTRDKPPNNWVSVFGKSMWEWDDTREQYYLHQFLKEQPDLNFNNCEVREEMKEVLRFWLQRGVYGFRIDAIKHIFEDPDLRDEPLSGYNNTTPDDYGHYIHNMTAGLPELFEVIREWRLVLDEFQKNDGIDRMMMVESVSGPAETAPYYGNETYHLADLPLSLQLFGTLPDAEYVYKQVKEWADMVPKGRLANWSVGNHDNPRVANRTGQATVDMMNMINILLKGSPVTYYGEEIGMNNLFIPYNETIDPPAVNAGEDHYLQYTRDPERTPMQWDSSRFAGFTTGNKTWLPVHPNRIDINVEKQNSSSEASHLQIYRSLIALRKLPALKEGDLDFPFISKTIFTFTRTLPNNRCILVVTNFGDKQEHINFPRQNTIDKFDFPRWGRLRVASVGNEDVGALKRLDEILIESKEGLVIEFDPDWA